MQPVSCSAGPSAGCFRERRCCAPAAAHRSHADSAVLQTSAAKRTQHTPVVLAAVLALALPPARQCGTVWALSVAGRRTAQLPPLRRKSGGSGAAAEPAGLPPLDYRAPCPALRPLTSAFSPSFRPSERCCGPIPSPHGLLPDLLQPGLLLPRLLQLRRPIRGRGLLLGLP